MTESVQIDTVIKLELLLARVRFMDEGIQLYELDGHHSIGIRTSHERELGESEITHRSIYLLKSSAGKHLRFGFEIVVDKFLQSEEIERRISEASKLLLMEAAA